MNLVDRLLAHDAWTTRTLLLRCGELDDEQLDRQWDMGHQTLRKTFVHLIHNVEVWSELMLDGRTKKRDGDRLPDLLKRAGTAYDKLAILVAQVSDRDGWNELWLDPLESPPQQKSFGTAIAHVVTHSMHHRAQILWMMRQVGMSNLPEGDVFSWEAGHTAD